MPRTACSPPGGEAVPFPAAHSEPQPGWDRGSGARAGQCGVFGHSEGSGKASWLGSVPHLTPPPADPLLGGAAPERERAGQDPFPARDRGEAEEPDGLHLLLGQRGRLQRRGGRAPQSPREGTDTAGRWGPWHGSPRTPCPWAPWGGVSMGPAPGIPRHPVIPSRTSLGSPRRVCGVGAHGDEGLS